MSDHCAPARAVEDLFPSLSDSSVTESKSGASISYDESTRDRFFNPFRTARSEGAESLAKVVRSQVAGAESRQRRRNGRDQMNHERAVAAVITDVLHRHWTVPNGWVAVRMSNKSLSRKSRYRPPVLGEPLRGLLVLLERLGWIEVVRGHHNMLTRRATTIRATGRLLDSAARFHLGLEDLGLDPSEEVIILKPRKVRGGDPAHQHPDFDDKSGKGYLRYDDNEVTCGYRDKVRRINAWLCEAHIAYYGDDDRVDLSQRRLRRIFTESFTQGGRLFDGFWQQMSKPEREDLYVDGSDPVEVDYSQMAIRTVYAMAKQPYVGQDAYIVPGHKRYRKGIKKLVSAMLYSSKPLMQFPRGVREMLPKDADLSWLIRRIEETHAPIRDYFYRGIGLDAMFLESEVMVGVLLRLIDGGVVALPIHDAVIVAKRHLEVTTQVMMEVYKEHLGVAPVLNVGG